jgi:hypothetical protein
MHVRQWFGVVMLGVAVLLCGGTARAAFITDTLTTTASGTIDGTTETNAPLTVTVTYDPSGVTEPFPGHQAVVNQSVAVSFGGITDTITTVSTTSYVNFPSLSAGFLSIDQTVPGNTNLLLLGNVGELNASTPGTTVGYAALGVGYTDPSMAKGFPASSHRNTRSNSSSMVWH